MTINRWLEENLKSGNIKEDQIIVVYKKNNTIYWLGKAEFAPICMYDEFIRAEMVGHELRINETVPMSL